MEYLTEPRCAVARSISLHPWVTIPPLLAIATVLVYHALHPSLLPGRRRVVNVIIPGEIRPYPHASSLSPWSRWRTRYVWWRYARSRHMSARQLTASIRNDHEIDWLGGETPKNGDVVSAWDRVFVWSDDCIDMATLER